MTGVETATIIVSFVSLAISLIAAYKTYTFSEYQLRLSNRTEFQKLLVDIDKSLIEHPELWAIYDSYSALREADPVGRVRLQAFAHMVLNIFECVFAFYGDSPKLTNAEQESFQAWKGFLKFTLQESSLTRELLNTPKLRAMYHAKFLEEIDSILEPQNIHSSLPAKYKNHAN
jgi:hypothetical protein